MDSELRGKVLEACDTASEFTKLYYSSVDKKRHLIDRLYLDTGVFVWNGNGLSGKDEIKKYFQELPPTDHQIQSLDAQPVTDNAVSSQLTLLIQVGGIVRFENNAVGRPFQQTFLITAQGDKWKIASDCLRLQEIK